MKRLLALGLCSALLLSPVPALAANVPFGHAKSSLAARPAVSAPALRQAGNRPFSLADYKGKWVWLYFGFASCPGVCPYALDFVADEYRHLKRPDDVQMVFVSVDPARDTPEALAEFTRYFHPSIKGVTGDKASLDALTRAVGASYVIPEGAKPEDDYMVGHPNVVYVLDPEGRLAATYEPGTQAKPGELAADFNALDASAAEASTATAPPSPSTGDSWCGIGMEAGGTHEALMRRAATMGSGTSVQPAASPMRMGAWVSGDWLWMLHGDAVLGANVQGGPRGGATWAAENWAMLMGSRTLGPGILDVRLMGSLEPWTLPSGGTPQLFQTGETYQGRYLIDRQHPHDLLMELAGRYTWVLNDRTGLFAYGGPVGEPALGPSAFMHRPSAADNHWAPLGHHLQDATHISHGVATVGARHGDFQLEGSLFNGREPDENRLDLEFGPLDSWATRLSWFPGQNWALQASYGYLKEPERLHAGDTARLSASAMHVGLLPWGRWSSALIWGQNSELDALGNSLLVLQSYGLESQMDVADVHHLYGRLELVDKAGLPPAPPLSHVTRRVNALTLGYVRDLGNFEQFSLGLGGDVTLYSLAPELAEAYGSDPLSFRVFLRLRPPTMRQLEVGKLD